MRSIYVTLFFLTTALTGSSQDIKKTLSVSDSTKYVAYYKHTWVADSNNTSAKSSEFMRLDIGNKLSRFESIGTYLSDSLDAVFQNQAVDNASLNLYASIRSSLPGSANRYKVYKNVSASALAFCENLSRKNYAYLDSFPAKNWSITNDVKRIGNYSCQKALVSFRGRQYEAWFTRGVPVSDGPYKFYGLPGLIVKLNDTHNQYTFELVSFGKSRTVTSISLPKQVIMTTRQALVKGKKDYYESLVDRVASMPHQTPLTPADLEAERRRVKKKFSNSIELR